MSQDSSFLKENLNENLRDTLDLIETDLEIKSYIYQQILDFNPFVTPETLVMVLARDPEALYSAEDENEDEDENHYGEVEQEAVAGHFKYRIAVILKDGESSIEAEAFNDDIFEAIRLAKEQLIERLLQIQEEVENPLDRIKAIKEASDNSQIH